MGEKTKKCYGCAYYEPKSFCCYRYLRGVETAIYLCPFCREDENTEMKEVAEKGMTYGEYLNG